MTIAALEKYRNYTLNKQGKPIAVSLDLKNRLMQKFFSKMMEDFEDTLIALERQDEEAIPLDKVLADIRT